MKIMRVNAETNSLHVAVQWRDARGHLLCRFSQFLTVRLSLPLSSQIESLLLSLLAFSLDQFGFLLNFNLVCNIGIKPEHLPPKKEQ